MPRDYQELRCLVRSSAAGQALAIGGITPEACGQALRQLEIKPEPPSASADELLLEASKIQDDQGALLCLRCRVSWPLEAKLHALHRQFGRAYQLDPIALASYVLDDVGRLLPYASPDQPSRRPDPFTLDVVRSYQPGHCGLPHWARQKFQAHNGLKAYLKEQGLLLIGDWALLADTSARRIHESWESLGKGSLNAESAVALHQAYLPEYRQAKELHEARTGRQSGWNPDQAFFERVDPSQPAQITCASLKAMADAVRLLKSGRWQRSLEVLQADVPDIADPYSLEGDLPGDADDSQALRSAIEAALDRAMQTYLPVVLNVPEQDRELLHCLWSGYAEGLGQRPLAERCQCSQTQVSRKLNLKVHAMAIATRAAVELSRLPAFASVTTSVEGAERLVAALRNHLSEPEREGDVAPLRRWVQQHMNLP